MVTERTARTGLVDTHAHFLTADYVAAARGAGVERPDGMPGWPTWSQDAHLQLMDRIGVARSILSISSPGVHLGDDDRARELARHVNDAAAHIVAGRPDRFGFFAALPLPDVAGCLAELAPGFAAGAAGVVVETSAGGVYLADPRLEPLWQELDRRAAVVFVHPTSPPGAEQVDQGLPRPMLEFIFDTTRTFTGLIANRVPERYPDIRWIVPHTGAALPLLADRIGLVLAMAGDGSDRPVDVHAALQRFWYDTAGVPVPHQLPVLLDGVDASRVLYGSDYCWTPDEPVERQVAALERFYAGRSADWRADLAANAAALLAT